VYERCAAVRPQADNGITEHDGGATESTAQSGRVAQGAHRREPTEKCFGLSVISAARKEFPDISEPTSLWVIELGDIDGDLPMLPTI
jgi:hypothetical protein